MTLYTEQELKAKAFFNANMDREKASLAFALWGRFLTVSRLEDIKGLDVSFVVSWVEKCNKEIGER